MKLRSRDKNNNDLDGAKLKPLEAKVSKRTVKKAVSLVSLGQATKTSKKQANRRNSIKLEIAENEQPFDSLALAKTSKEIKTTEIKEELNACDDKSTLKKEEKVEEEKAVTECAELKPSKAEKIVENLSSDSDSDFEEVNDVKISNNNLPKAFVSPKYHEIKPVATAATTSLDSTLTQNIEKMLAMEQMNNFKSNNQNSGAVVEHMDDEDDFEEVEMEQEVNMEALKRQGPIQVNIHEGKSKKKVDLAAKMARMMKALQKQQSIEVHKSHLVCWLTHGFYLNKICLSDQVRATALSMSPALGLERKFQLINFDKTCLKNLLVKIKKKVELVNQDTDFLAKNSLVTEDRICEAVCELKCSTYLEYILLVLILFRNMGLRARLCVCFEAHEINEDSKKLQALMNKSKPKEQTVAKTSSTKRKSTTSESAKGSKGMPKNKKQKSTTSLAGKLSQLSDENESSEDEGMSSDSEPKTKKKKRVASRAKKGSKKVKDEDSEYEEKDRSKNLVKKPTLKKSNSQILSSDEVVEVASTSKPKVCREACARNYWLEVYLEEERVWQPIDPLSPDTDLVGDYFEKRFEKQILYACVFDNDNRVKDVTKRYSSKWTTSTRLLRVDYIEKKLWWERTMLLKQTLDADLDIEEEKQLKKMLLGQSLPVSVSEFKDHPLYVLKRHLLKYQEIYPQDAEPVGHLRNEPIYSRDNQVTLHSRQTWLKYARKVKPYENPYKIVKGRIKQSDYKNGVRENPDLDIYGYWQTNLYDPPIAENGRIPLNEFGNVELFQPCMLPIGTVHLKNMPNLNKLCRKLKLDCAAAVVGFDAHSGFSHAVFNGWVVCEEHKDTIVAAYREEEVRANLKLIEKQQERVWGNWRRIIRALQIREHLKLKYGTEDTDGFKKSKSKQHDSEDEQDQSGQSKKNKQASKVITKKGKKTTPTKKATVKKVKKSSENKQESDEEASYHLKLKRNRKSQESSRTLREDDEKEIECQSSIETNSRSSGTLDNQNESLVLSEVED